MSRIDLAKYNKLKKKLDKYEQLEQRSKGALEQLLQQLNKEFGCKTIEQGQVKLKELRREQKENERKFNKALKKFEREFAEFIERVEKALEHADDAAESGAGTNQTRKKKSRST